MYGDEGRLGIPYDHLALRVRTVDGGEWLADVGFGAHSHYPLAFGARGEQEDPGGTFRIVEAGPDAAGVRSGDGAVKKGGGDAADLDVLMGGRSQYRLEVRPRVLGDFVAGAWWHSTSSASHFTRSLVCSRVTEDGGRITLSGRTFKVTAADGAREERELETDEEVLGAYRERFGIELDRVAGRASPRRERRCAGRVGGVSVRGTGAELENGAVSDVRHVLVLPDRDAAEEVVEALSERFGMDEEPQVVRDALAGEDDAEDAQWLVVLRDAAGRLDAGELNEFVGEWEGWREEP